MKPWLKAFLQAAGIIAATCAVFWAVGYARLQEVSWWFYLLPLLPIAVAICIVKPLNQTIRMVAAEITLWVVGAISIFVIGLLIDQIDVIIICFIIAVYQVFALGSLLIYLMLCKRALRKPTDPASQEEKERASLRNRRILVGIVSGITLLLLVFSCLSSNTSLLTGIHQRSLEKRISDLYADVMAGEVEEDAEIYLDELTDFQWDSVYLFNGYAPEAQIDKALGFDSRVGPTYQDGYSHIVFVKGDAVVCHLITEGPPPYWFDMPEGQAVSCSEARFRLSYYHSLRFYLLTQDA